MRIANLRGALLLCAPLLLTACPDDPPAMTGGSSSTGQTSIDLTTTTTTGEDSTGTTTDDSADSTSGSSTGEPGVYCETMLCGPQLTCCGEGTECIDDLCVDACTTGVRCGADLGACCADGEVCLDEACVVPSGACIDSYDCPMGEYCEPNLDQCLPSFQPALCELSPPDFDTLDLELEWSWQPAQLRSTPLLADVDGDSLPEVVVNSYFLGGVHWRAEIHVLDGASGNLQTTVVNDPDNGVYGSYSRTTPAVGDVDGDGMADIVYSGYPEVDIPPFANNMSRIHAIDGQGQPLWSAHAADDTPYYVFIRNGGITLANLDADDASEVILGTAILDHDGTIVFDQDNGNGLGGAVYGTNGNATGGMSVVADLTGDGYPEIISGHEAWTVDWTDGAPPTVNLDLLWEYAGADGTPAVADLDGNGTPEVVIVGDPAPFTSPYDSQVHIIDGATGELWCGVDPTGATCAGNDAVRTQPAFIPGGGRGGQPTIADFDGDGRPEIAVAGATAIAIFDINRPGESVVQPAGDPPPLPGGLYPRWFSPAQDGGTDVTGVSAFDFQGDGAVEVLYNDQCYLRVYDGATGNVMAEVENSSDNLRNAPVVADVDDDGDSELLVMANDNNAANNCEATIPGYTTRRGLYVYSDANDQWARTRQVWNGHDYHVTNSTSTGLVPAVEANNWEDPSLNNHRESLDRGGLHAPDLVVSLSVGVAMCDAESLEIIAVLRNVGAFSVGSGIDVSLYRGTDASGQLLNTQSTSQSMLPGGQTRLSWIVDNDDGAGADGSVSECIEDNNSATLTGIVCPEPM